jgi:hypothetical protein
MTSPFISLKTKQKRLTIILLFIVLILIKTGFVLNKINILNINKKSKIET